MSETGAVDAKQVLEELGYKTIPQAYVNRYKKIVEEHAGEVISFSSDILRAAIEVPVVLVVGGLLNKFVATYKIPSFLVSFCSNDSSYVNMYWAFAVGSMFACAFVAMEAYSFKKKATSALMRGWKRDVIKDSDVPKEYRPILHEMQSGWFVKESFVKKWKCLNKDEEFIIFRDASGQNHYLAMKDTKSLWV